MPEIVRVTEADWADLRETRLAALAADPSAFGSTLARELDFGEQTWRDRIASACTLLAREQGRPVGLGTVAAAPDGIGVELTSMWVAPEHRGTGVGSALLAALIQQARLLGRQSLRLYVTAGNDVAAALYERHGFTATGRTEPLPSDPQLTMSEYVLALG